jgi:RTX calcium-binding nonapeptide repeat (4 copies)
MIVVVLLAVFQLSAFVGAQAANASTCVFAGGVLTVTLTGGEDPTFGLAAGGEGITLDVCAPDGATVSSTIAITVVGDGGDNVVTIDMANGVFSDIIWTLRGGGGDDSLAIDGSDRNDVVDVGASGIDLDGDGAVDVISLATIPEGSGTLRVNGAGGNDKLTAYGSGATGAPYARPVTIQGDAGSDDVGGGSAADVLDGGAGTFDFVDYLRFRAAVTIDLTTSSVSGGGGSDTIAGFENIIGSRKGDTLTGKDLEDNDITGGPGDDTIDCVGGSVGDFVDFFDSANAVDVDVDAGSAAGNGSDRFTNCPSVYGSDGGDTITGSSTFNDLQGAGGNDVIASHGGDDHLAGQAGRDWVDYGWADQPVAVALNCLGGLGTGSITAGAGATTDVIDSMENAILTPGDDSFFGNEFRNRVRPNGGRNTLDGDGGVAVCGGSSIAPAGGDTLDYSVGYDAGVTIDMTGARATADSTAGFENVTATPFADDVTGDDGPNRIRVGRGNDTVRAGRGDDTVTLGAGRDIGGGDGGADRLVGRGGGDILLGGVGEDVGKGGPGRDVCRRVEVATSCGTARHPA